MVGVRKALKKGLSWGFSPKKWIGVDHVRSQGKICKDLAKGLVSDKKSFIEGLAARKAQQEPKLTPAEQKKRKLASLLLIVTYVILAMLALGYAWYLGMGKSLWLAGLVSVAIALLLLTYSLRELVLYAQLRLRRNRVQVKEVLKFVVKGFPQ